MTVLIVPKLLDSGKPRTITPPCRMPQALMIASVDVRAMPDLTHQADYVRGSCLLYRWAATPLKRFSTVRLRMKLPKSQCQHPTLETLPLKIGCRDLRRERHARPDSDGNHIRGP